MEYGNLGRYGWWRLVALTLAIGMNGSPRSAAQEDMLVQQVIDGISRNYASIGSVRGAIQEQQHDRSVAGGKEVTVNVNRNGSTSQVTRFADMWWSTRFVIRGDDYLFTKRPSHSEDLEILSKRAAEWTLYSERNGQPRASIWRSDQLPGKLPFDPREFACDELEERVIDVLREHKIVSAERVSSEKRAELIRICTNAGRGRVERVWEFDVRQNCLPVRRYNSWSNDDDSMLQVVEVDYREVLNGAARFPVKMVRRFYDKGVTRNPQSSAWRQRIEQFVTRLDVKGPENIDVTRADIEVKFRSGTRVADNIRRKVYRAP